MKGIYLKKETRQNGRPDVASYDYLLDLTSDFFTGKH